MGGYLGEFGKWIGLTSDRGQNPYQGVDQGNYQLPGYQQRDQQYLGYQAQAGGRQAPTIGAADQFRDRQVGLADQLARLASGQDSYSREQLRQAAGANISQQQALMASNRANPAMAARMAMQNAGRINQGLAGQQALAGIAERNQAAMGLGGLLGQARGADEQRALEQALMQQRQMGMNDQTQLGWAGLGLQNAGMQQAGMMGFEGQRGQRFLGYMGTPTANEQMLGGISSTLSLLGIGKRNGGNSGSNS